MMVSTFTNFSMLHVLPILWLLFTASMTAKNVLAHQENRSLLFPTAATIRTLTTTTTRTFPVPYVVKLPSPLSSLQRLQRLRGGGGSSSSTGIATSTATRSSRVQPKPSPEGTVDATSQVINLIKTIIGAGVLGIPAGMTASFAATSSSNSILGRSLSLLILIGLLAANGFNNIGQICRSTNSFSYAQAWNRTVSETTTILPNVACVMVTFCTLVTYSMVLSDTIPSLLRPIIEHQPLEMLKRALPHVTRTNVLLLLSTFILLPLCLLQSLSALAPFSFVGICGMIYTAVIMTVRYLDKSYSTTGRFIATIEPKLRPNFDLSSPGTIPSGNAAILISMLSTAYMAHYNAPKFYWELANRTSEKYSMVVYQSFIGAIIIMIVISAMGFLTFGTNSQSLILNNYSHLDQLMSLSRWAVVLSLIFSYPLAFVGVRDGIYNLFNIRSKSSDEGRRINQLVTVTILSTITLIAAILKDIRVILSLGGATFGNLLSYVFPAFMVVGLANKKRAVLKQQPGAITTADAFPTPNQERFAILTAVLGVMMGIVGTIKAIQAI